MHLLYSDDSGSVSDPNQHYFVLAGFSTFERQAYWISEKLEEVMVRYQADLPPTIELHGNLMLQGNGEWRSVPRGTRMQIFKEALGVIARSHNSNRLFAVAVRKAISPKHPVEYCFEQLCSRFDQYLRRLHLAGDTQRGIIVFDKNASDISIQKLASDFRTIGHTWGVVTNLAEVPVFIDSKASRLVQLADLIAYSVFRKFDRSDPQFYDLIAHRFDTEAGVVHGLHHRD